MREAIIPPARRKGWAHRAINANVLDSMASASAPAAPKMIIITQERTMSTAAMVHKVRRSFSIMAARMQATRGVRLQTTPIVLT